MYHVIISLSLPSLSVSQHFVLAFFSAAMHSIATTNPQRDREAMPHNRQILESNHQRCICSVIQKNKYH